MKRMALWFGAGCLAGSAAIAAGVEAIFIYERRLASAASARTSAP